MLKLRDGSDSTAPWSLIKIARRPIFTKLPHISPHVSSTLKVLLRFSV